MSAPAATRPPARSAPGRPAIANREGLEEYDVTWAWQAGSLRPGLTAVLRVYNEARNLPWVLPRILDAVDHVVVVDNRSTDGTPELVRGLAARAGAEQRLTLTAYPFRVSRCGSEHLDTPGDSVHSLTHFYNWSFARSDTALAMKWDGDMVLTQEGVDALRDLAWQLQDRPAAVFVPRHPLVVESDRVAYADLRMRQLEPWVFPMGPDFVFLKAMEWELPEFPDDVPRIEVQGGVAVELKWLDVDEFAHWSEGSDFTRNRSKRKLREQITDRAIRSGEWDAVPGLHRIEAPDGVHVVDHVVDTWLPAQPRPLHRAPVSPSVAR